MGTGDLCAKLVPPTLLFLAHIPMNVNHMPNGPAEIRMILYDSPGRWCSYQHLR